MVADFGLTRDIGDTSEYVSRGGLIPVRWTAPEALDMGAYSTKTDVYAFGILLYEIFTDAGVPFGDMTNDKVWHHVLQGGRMEAPPNCTPEVYKIMELSWHHDPQMRPSFDSLVKILQGLEQGHDVPAEPTSSATENSSYTAMDNYASTTFNTWMVDYAATNHDKPTKILGATMQKDPNFPKEGDLSQYESYLQIKGAPAPIIRALRKSVRKYESEVNPLENDGYVQGPFSSSIHDPTQLYQQASV